MRLALSKTQKTGFLASYVASYLDSSRTNITSAKVNKIKKILRKLYSSDMLTGVTSFGCALHRLIHKSFITTAHRGGGGGGHSRDFYFLVAGPWHDPVLTAPLPGWGVVTNDWWA